MPSSLNSLKLVRAIISNTIDINPIEQDWQLGHFCALTRTLRVLSQLQILVYLAK